MLKDSITEVRISKDGIHAVTKEPLLRCMANIPPKELDWLWPNRIPLGRITLIAGRPGLGKSFVTCDLVSAITTGRQFPDGSTAPNGEAILIACEDDPSDTIRPRLDSAGADVEKVHLLTGVKTNRGDSSDRALFTLNDVDVLETSLRNMPNCKLVVIDPIGSYLGSGTQANSDNEVRAVLAPVAQIAEEHAVSVLVVAHTRKSTATFADDMVLGSRAFTGVARMVWHVMQDPDDEDKRLLLQGKNNIGQRQDGLSFSIGGSPPRVLWGESESRSATDVMQAAQGGTPNSDGSALSEAIAWLQHYLQAGPQPRAELKEAATRDGLAEKTLHRASKKLGIEKKPGGFGEGWVWELPKELAKNGPDCSELAMVEDMANTGQAGEDLANTEVNVEEVF